MDQLITMVKLSANVFKFSNSSFFRKNILSVINAESSPLQLSSVCPTPILFSFLTFL